MYLVMIKCSLKGNKKNAKKETPTHKLIILTRATVQESSNSHYLFLRIALSLITV